MGARALCVVALKFCVSSVSWRGQIMTATAMNSVPHHAHRRCSLMHCWDCSKPLTQLIAKTRRPSVHSPGRRSLHMHCASPPSGVPQPSAHRSGAQRRWHRMSPSCYRHSVFVPSRQTASNAFTILTRFVTCGHWRPLVQFPSLQV